MSEVDPLVARFLNWEQSSRDTIDFKKAYIDMAGDLIAGLVLSQIVYWHLPGRNGVTKLSVSHDGELWIAKKRTEWWNEIRVTPKQLDRALIILEKKQLIITALYHFGSKPTKHIRINWSGFLPLFDQFSISPKVKMGSASNFPKGQNAISPKGKILYTESTSIDYSLPATANAERVDEPPKRKPQPQAELLDAWIATIGKETLPPGFAYGSYMRFTSKLVHDGVTPASLTLAASLYHTWGASHPGRFTPAWGVDAVTANVTAALTLAASGVTADDVARFVKAKLAETDKNGTRFWAGKMVPFSHVASNIGVWLAEHPAAPPLDPSKPRTWFDENTSFWYRETNGVREQRDPNTAEWRPM